MHGRRRLVAGGRPPGRLEADPAQEREQDQAAAEQHEDQPEVDLQCSTSPSEHKTKVRPPGP
jgi:hypothetical protein